VNQCPNFYFASSGICVDCPDNCLSCFESSSCQSCGDGYVLNDENLCDPENVKVLGGPYFPFTIFSLIAIGFIGYKECRKKVNLFSNNSLSVVVFFEYFSWIVLFLLYLIEGMSVPGAFVLIVFLSSIAINIIFWFRFYKKLPKNDSEFNYWRIGNKRAVRIFEIMGLVLSFRVLRFTFGRFNSKGWTNAEFKNRYETLKTYNRYSWLCLVCNAALVIINFASLTSINQRS